MPRATALDDGAFVFGVGMRTRSPAGRNLLKHAGWVVENLNLLRFADGHIKHSPVESHLHSDTKLKVEKIKNPCFPGMYQTTHNGKVDLGFHC